MDILKLYIKTFLYSFVIVGVGFFLIFHYVEPGYSVDTSLIGALIGAIIAGGIMTFLAAPKQIRGDGSIFPTKASEDIILKKDLKESFQISADVLKHYGFKIEEENPQARFLKASSGAKINSFGEKILLTFETISPNETQLKIMSKPKIVLSFIDLGTNYTNVKKISDALKKAS